MKKPKTLINREKKLYCTIHRYEPFDHFGWSITNIPIAHLVVQGYKFKTKYEIWPELFR